METCTLFEIKNHIKKLEDTIHEALVWKLEEDIREIEDESK